MYAYQYTFSITCPRTYTCTYTCTYIHVIYFSIRIYIYKYLFTYLFIYLHIYVYIHLFIKYLHIYIILDAHLNILEVFPNTFYMLLLLWETHTVHWRHLCAKNDHILCRCMSSFSHSFRLEAALEQVLFWNPGRTWIFRTKRTKRYIFF